VEESGRGRERMRWEGKKEEGRRKQSYDSWQRLGAVWRMNGISRAARLSPDNNHMVFLPFSIFKNCGLRNYVKLTSHRLILVLQYTWGVGRNVIMN